MAKIPGFKSHLGKGSNQELLPSRHAMSQLAGGSPLARSMNSYAKATPSGANSLGASPSILGMAANKDGGEA